MPVRKQTAATEPLPASGSGRSVIALLESVPAYDTIELMSVSEFVSRTDAASSTLAMIAANFDQCSLPKIAVIENIAEFGPLANEVEQILLVGEFVCVSSKAYEAWLERGVDRKSEDRFCELLMITIAMDSAVFH